jgi:hypothetical protein
VTVGEGNDGGASADRVEDGREDEERERDAVRADRIQFRPCQFERNDLVELFVP